MTLNLLVIKVKNLKENFDFYSQLGFFFTAEIHGNGPAHFAAETSGMIFELYPCRKNEVVSNVRLGFKFKPYELKTQQIKPWVIAQAKTTYIDNDGNVIYVLVDPDKRKIEVGFNNS